MSVKIMALVFDNKDLSSTDKLIMLALADHANDEGKSIYPSQGRLSHKTGLARGTINKHIHDLVEKEYLTKVGYKQDRSNALEVEICLDKLKSQSGVTEDDNRCHGELHQVSRRVTPGVTEDDTNHQLITNESSIKESPQEPEKSDHPEVVAALEKLTGMDMKIKSNAGRIVRAAKELREAGYTVEDLRAFYRYWRDDWRSNGGTAFPTLKIIKEDIGKATTGGPAADKFDQEKRRKAAQLEIEKAKRSK